MLVFWNDGIFFRREAASYVIHDDEVAFPDDPFPSDDTLTQYFPGYPDAKAAVDGPALFAQALEAGLDIVFARAPALNGTYRVNDAAQRNISGIAASIASRGRVPGGGANFEYPDITGADHTFTAAQFLDFATAVEDYIYGLSRGQNPAQPWGIP